MKGTTRMRWRQFFTPTGAMNAKEAKRYIDGHAPSDITVLDVRQPSEYRSGHIPGAKLIPVPELPDRISEIDPKKPVVVYCALGGRSRAAAQMLSGKGFDDVINLTGGYKAWEGKSAFGPETLGLPLFSGNETLEQSLIAAYSLEAGLHDFYVSAVHKTTSPDVKSLFEKLAKIEVIHQEKILDQYQKLTGKPVVLETFLKNQIRDAAEGGMTTDEYIRMFRPDWNSVADAADLAMSIEAQALDLYMRAADRCSNPESRKAILRIADEEKAHLALLGKLIDGSDISK
jgi:rhodanese-related sulfurtransferase/rubrerythrin